MLVLSNLPNIEETFDFLLGPRGRTRRYDILERELLGRLPVKVALIHIAERALAHLLLNEHILLDLGKEPVQLLYVVHLCIFIFVQCPREKKTNKTNFLLTFFFRFFFCFLSYKINLLILCSIIVNILKRKVFSVYSSGYFFCFCWCFCWCMRVYACVWIWNSKSIAESVRHNFFCNRFHCELKLTIFFFSRHLNQSHAPRFNKIFWLSVFFCCCCIDVMQKAWHIFECNYNLAVAIQRTLFLKSNTKS